MTGCYGNDLEDHYFENKLINYLDTNSLNEKHVVQIYLNDEQFIINCNVCFDNEDIEEISLNFIKEWCEIQKDYIDLNKIEALLFFNKIKKDSKFINELLNEID